MEMPLNAFVVVVGVALTGNALGILLAYRAFSKMTRQVTASVDKCKMSESTLTFLRSLESMSIQAALLTFEAKKEIENFEPALAHAQDVYGYGLAVIDTRFERICNIVTENVDKTMDAIAEPAYRVHAVTSRIRGVADRFRGGDAIYEREPAAYDEDLVHAGSGSTR